MESKPMTTSEPTTGEIVRALRSMQTSAQVVLDSGFGTREGECDVVYRNRRDLAKNAADRLESQERNIETLRAFHERYAEQTSKKYVEEICALTARAEQERLNPQPLTLDEMNAIDNEPLYILHVDSISNGAAWHMNGWHVLKAGTCRNHGQSNWCADYGKNELNGNYGKTWLAYRTKPEGEGK
jgi:hypothetical protein